MKFTALSIIIGLVLASAGHEIDPIKQDTLKNSKKFRSKKLVVKGTPQLFEYLFDEEAPAGMGDYFWCAFEAPAKAARGNAVEAVNCVMKAVAALSAGVFEAVLDGIPGGIIGQGCLLLAQVPGNIIKDFDTSETQYRIEIYNLTKYPVFIDSSMVNPELRDGILNQDATTYTTEAGEGPGQYSDEGWSHLGATVETKDGSSLYNSQGKVIPPTAYDPKTKKVGSFCLPLAVKDDNFCFSMRFFAREGSCTPGKTTQWWRETRQQGNGVKYSWAVGCSSNKLATIWPAAGHKAPEHKHAYDNMIEVPEWTSAYSNRPGNKGSNSACYWKDGFKTLVVKLGMPDAKN